MRLLPEELTAIRDVSQRLDSEAAVFLFGSRTRDELKGGDIGLLIVSDKLNFSDKLTFLTELKQKIGEQKIDVLVKQAGELQSDPFVISILQNAIKIVG